MCIDRNGEENKYYHDKTPVQWLPLFLSPVSFVINDCIFPLYTMLFGHVVVLIFSMYSFWSTIFVTEAPSESMKKTLVTTTVADTRRRAENCFG